MIKKLIVLCVIAFSAVAGEYKSVVIPTGEKCCECDCEFDPENDFTYYGEDMHDRYRFFGGVPHICLGTHCRDEKGIDLEHPEHVHICKGEWCDKRCCISFEDYFAITKRYEDVYIRGNNIHYPVIPGPGPVTKDN